ncbi:MAG: 4-hydroxybenzoate octaprenyltransferase, partial [Sinobacterium sp.]
RVDKPIGSYLVIWPALWSLWIAAKGMPDLLLIIVFIMGAFLMRSAGCVINDFADRNIDTLIERTKQRPLALGLITPKEAIQLFILLCTAAAFLLVFTNRLTVLLAFVALLLAALYPFTKRFTHLPQVILGMAFSCSIPMAFAAQTNSLPAIILPLYSAVMVWVIVYDTFYAMVDRDDDLIAGVKSTAILFGRYDRQITALLQFIFIALMIKIGLLLELGRIYYGAICMSAILFAYQQLLISHRDKNKYFIAFLNNNYVGLVIFLGLVADFAFHISL